MRPAVRLPLAVAVLAPVLALSGCSADPRGELRRSVADITDDANARDADGVRDGVETLLERLDDAVRSGEVSSAEAARISELARLLSERADALEPEPSPAPTSAPPRTSAPASASPRPTRTSASPSPSPTPSPTPSATPTSEPTPEPDDDPDDDDSDGGDPTLVPELPGG